MAFKLFDETDVKAFTYGSTNKISLSNPSSSSNIVDFFTGVRSFGKISSHTSATDAEQNSQVTYEWKFDKSVLQDSSLTAERTVGKFLSTADQNFITSNNQTSTIGHVPVFNNAQTMFYHVDTPFNPSHTGVTATSNGAKTSILKSIILPKRLFNSRITPASIRIEVDNGTSSNTGVVSTIHPTTSRSISAILTTAADFKNPFASPSGQTGFVVVPFNSTSLNQNVSSLDNITHSISVEAIIRPYNSNSTILYRRISPVNSTKTEFLSKDSFIKLELVPSADGLDRGFRFYIRDAHSSTGFSGDFAQENVQASGLFVPSDVGINLYDGRFHHIVCTWSVSGFDASGNFGDETDPQLGSGVVMGYVDGFKLLNKEQVDPILGSSDGSGGPVLQSNMLEQRIPVKQTPLSLTSHGGGYVGSSSANLFIGVSTYLEKKDTLTTDINQIPTAQNTIISGLFDGQIQSIRMWNIRLLDGSTSYNHNINTKVAVDSTGLDIYKTYNNYHDSTLTAGASATNLLGFWDFRERNTLTAQDYSTSYSNTATFVGNVNTRLYDHVNIIRDKVQVTTTADFINSSLSTINRVFLYQDRPEKEIIRNDFDKGNISRISPASDIIDVGAAFYDHGIIFFDGNDQFAKLNWLYPSSGTTGDWGFNVVGTEAAFNVQRLVIDSNETVGRLILNAVGEGNEFNFSKNVTSFDAETGQSIFDENVSYITSIGLYNDFNDLVAIAKLSKPVRKDEFTKIVGQIKLDF